MSEKGKRRLNTYFRQTARAFKVIRQTQVFSHINRNIPYRMYQFSRQQFLSSLQKMNSILAKQRQRFAKGKFEEKTKK